MDETRDIQIIQVIDLILHGVVNDRGGKEINSVLLFSADLFDLCCMEN